MEAEVGKLQLHITADKRLRYASSKLPVATSFIRKTLSEMLLLWEE